MGLPRTQEALYQRLKYNVIEVAASMPLEAGLHKGTRWGPWSSWWEPYLQLAILANEQNHDPNAAAQILQIGMERANYKAPLSCYHLEAIDST